jgi:Zn-dependent M32 family carboxypeptidase
LSLQDLVREATGKPLAAAAALRHLERKYLGRESVV